jgi:hypothetical protein
MKNKDIDEAVERITKWFHTAGRLIDYGDINIQLKVHQGGMVNISVETSSKHRLTDKSG